MHNSKDDVLVYLINSLSRSVLFLPHQKQEEFVPMYVFHNHKGNIYIMVSEGINIPLILSPYQMVRVSGIN